MTNNLFFDFQVDKAAKKVFVTREFAAPLSLVWDAFTKAELLDQWVAPAPYQARTKYMNFEEGGKRFYAMVSPEGKESWALQQFSAINPKTGFNMFNVFADKDENPEKHGSEWEYRFGEKDGITTVQISIYNESFERMESLLAGFQMGFTASLQNLEKLLVATSNA